MKTDIQTNAKAAVRSRCRQQPLNLETELAIEIKTDFRIVAASRRQIENVETLTAVKPTWGRYRIDWQTHPVQRDAVLAPDAAWGTAVGASATVATGARKNSL